MSRAQIEFEDISYSVDVPVMGSSVENVGTAFVNMFSRRETARMPVLSGCSGVFAPGTLTLVCPRSRAALKIMIDACVIPCREFRAGTGAAALRKVVPDQGAWQYIVLHFGRLAVPPSRAHPPLSPPPQILANRIKEGERSGKVRPPLPSPRPRF